MEKRVTSKRPSLKIVFSSRSTGLARVDRSSRLWEGMKSASHLRGLGQPAKYLRQMPEDIARNLQTFVRDWFNKRAVLTERLDADAKRKVKDQGVRYDNGFEQALQNRLREVERRFSEKAALDQIAWVFSHQKMLSGRREKIDPLRAGNDVMKLAQELNREKDKAAAFVRLAERVAEIRLIATHSAIAEAYYGLPTAEETLMLKSILVGRKEGLPAWGCGMLCDVMNAVLTHAKWENRQVRTVDRKGRPHSIVLAKVPDTKIWLVADPYSRGHMFLYGLEPFRKCDVVSQVGEYLGEEIEKLKRRGLWKEGRCQRELVKNFNEFRRGF